MNEPIIEHVLKGFVPRFFLGLVVLGASVDTVIPLFQAWLPSDNRSALTAFALADGTIVGLLSYLAPLFKGGASGRSSRERASIGFAAGLLAPMALDPVLSLVALCAILILAGVNVRRFIVHIRTLLHPGAFPDWSDVRCLIMTHVNLLSTYVIVNIALALHSGEGRALKNAFNFSRGREMVVDALYFSIVVMTTLGFGDVTPQSPLARLVVSFECLLSYGMLALTIGVITRGIVDKS